MSEEEQSNQELVPARDLTLAEQQRIKNLKQVRGNEERRHELFEAAELLDGEVGLADLSNSELSGVDAKLEREARLLEATGCANKQAATTLLATFACPFFDNGTTPESLALNLNSIASLMAEFKPRDVVEGVLCGQIVACQQMGMEMLASSSKNKESVTWANSRGNAASKLLARSHNAIQMLINYRRGREQKIVVEHINIEPGGKAAFGTFNTGRGGEENKNIGGTA